MSHPIVSATEKYVKDELDGLCTAHDFYHIERVLKLARKIHADEMQWDLLVIELGALLHESFDEKFYSPEALIQKRASLIEFFKDQWLVQSSIDQVFYVIENVGFGKSLERTPEFVMTPELAIVEDADRLDAIGAIAIARTFSYGGKRSRPIYDPVLPIMNLTSNEEYRTGSNSSFHHFFEKLLKLKDLIHTASAKKIAESRHAFMEQFVAEFLSEWKGEDVV